jgi:hypothetical protein
MMAISGGVCFDAGEYALKVLGEPADPAVMLGSSNERRCLPRTVARIRILRSSVVEF